VVRVIILQRTKEVIYRWLNAIAWINPWVYMVSAGVVMVAMVLAAITW
jgi:hypothetical protein